MKQGAIITAGLILWVITSGCGAPGTGTGRNLGQVDYTKAFQTGKMVMGQYFSVAKFDPQTGEIHSRPMSVERGSERLIGESPARKVGKLSIRKANGKVVAYSSVILQTEESEIYQLQNISYDEIPNTTPAQGTAATTSQQNKVWKTQKYDHALERQILDDLYRALHPEIK